MAKNFKLNFGRVQWAIHNQHNGRNMTEADLLKCIEAVDKRRERGGDRKSEEAKSKASNDARLTTGKSAKETARIVGTSQAKVEHARKVLSDPKESEESRGNVSAESARWR